MEKKRQITITNDIKGSLGGLALLCLIALLAISSFINKEYVAMWFELVKLTLVYLFGVTFFPNCLTIFIKLKKYI